MDPHKLKILIEAMLMASSQPLSQEKLFTLFAEENCTEEELQWALEVLADDYRDRAIELVQVASGYIIQTKENFNHWISRLFTEKPAKYSTAFLETLTIIAYKQPVTRAEIEDLRGVAVNSAVMKSLLEREWIRIAGYRDVPGKPAVYTTTKQFLDYFHLKSLNELPELTSHSIEGEPQ